MKKQISILLVLLMILGISASAFADDTRVVTDVWGREVEIPAKVESIVCLGSGAPRMAAYLDVIGMMVGCEDHDKAGINILRDYSYNYADQIKDLPAIGSGGGSGANNGYAEEIINLQPDVILAGFSAEAADELSNQTGIPVVSVRYLSRNFVDESFYDAMRVFAETVGAQERCEKVLAYIDACKADLNARTENIPDEDKPAVYAGAVTFSGRHGFGGTYAHFGPLMGVNAFNVADEAADQNYYETDFEKIASWGQLISVAVSSATMSLVAQNLGARKLDRVQESIKGCVLVSSCGTIISIVLIFLLAPFLVARFNQNSDVIFYGTQMIRYSIFAMFFINLSHIYNAACRAAGNVKIPMVVAIFSQVICKYLFVAIGDYLYHDVHVLYLGTAFGYMLAGILATLYFYTSRWTRKHGLRA